MIHEWRRDGHLVSTDRRRIDLDLVHGFLKEAYWSRGIPRDLVERAARASLVFGLYDEAASAQLGYARVLTDYVELAYLFDLFVLPPHRGRGLGRWLLTAVLSHPDLADVRWWELATRDAHGLYAKLGFTPLAEPGLVMCRPARLDYPP